MGKNEVSANSNNSSAEELRNFLDTNQYSLKSILRYERIHGLGWTSTGGEQSTKHFAYELDLQPGQNVLDVGCGSGGSTLFFARHYSANVYGLDVSHNMIQLAARRKMQEEKAVSERAQFEAVDARQKQFENESFDLIYSRDAILYINDKKELYQKFYGCLKPGGKLFVSDFCRGTKRNCKEFEAYLEGRAYFLKTVEENRHIIKEAGFADVEAVDATDLSVSFMEDELKFLAATRSGFIKDFSEEEYEALYNGWANKIKWSKEGYKAWGVFKATK